MRTFHRVLATTVASLALAAAGIAGAGSAAASPEDGEGCAGLPSVPATYVCVISVTPENALPTTTTTYIPVTVPAVCYFLDCTEPTTVNVPVPGFTPGSGTIAVLWYQGQYIPISVTLGTVTALLDDVVTLVTDTVAFVTTTINDVVNGLPTVDELVDYVLTHPVVRAAWSLLCSNPNFELGVCTWIAWP